MNLSLKLECIEEEAGVSEIVPTGADAGVVGEILSSWVSDD